MSWISILTALVLAVASAYLVFCREWPALEAGLVVGCVAVALISAMIGLMLLATDKKERPQVMREFVLNLRADFDDALRWFHLKR